MKKLWLDRQELQQPEAFGIILQNLGFGKDDIKSIVEIVLNIESIEVKHQKRVYGTHTISLD